MSSQTNPEVRNNERSLSDSSENDALEASTLFSHVRCHQNSKAEKQKEGKSKHSPQTLRLEYVN